MGNQLSGLGSALYDSKRREFLGRDGARWGKLGVFYFFFYLGLAGFFCAMLAVFMAFTPRDHPYYTSEDSRMQTRSNPLSPGLGFRPQPDVERNLIAVQKYGPVKNETLRYIKSLDQYLQVYYWKKEGNQQDFSNNPGSAADRQFTIGNAGECTSGNSYGYSNGRPCVLVKMNKIVDFIPSPLTAKPNGSDIPDACRYDDRGVKIVCQGEYPADIDNIGTVQYYSEKRSDYSCGSLDTNRFPFMGKKDRKDVYQAPYVWVQFTSPKPNVLINVICRAHAQNIDFDKKAGRGLTRFQIYVEDLSKRSPRSVGEI